MYQQSLFPVRVVRETAQVSTTQAAPENVCVSPVSIPPALIEQVYNDFVNRLSAGQKARLNGRVERALKIAATDDAVHFTADPLVFKVKSTSARHCTYTVTLGETKTCTCPDHKDNGNTCKHILASYFTKKAYELSLSQVASPVEPSPAPQPPAPQPDQVIGYTAAARQLKEGETIVYATLVQGDEVILVEVIETDPHTTSAFVRSLPVMDKDGYLVPNFCFPSPSGTPVKYSSTWLPFESLVDVKIFRSTPK